MVTPYLILPKDPTGVAASNQIVNEYHKTIGAGRSIIRPHYGTFYKSGLAVYSLGSVAQRQLLTEGIDYVLGALDTEVTQVSGQPAYSSLLIVNNGLPSLFQLDYRAYGGGDHLNYPLISDALVKAQNGTPVNWGLIANTPTHYPPEEHKHDAADVYGMEAVTKWVTAIGDAITQQRVIHSNQNITEAIWRYQGAVRLLNSKTYEAIRQHIDNAAFSHAYAPDQVGLGLLGNYGFDGTGERYASPVSVQSAIYEKPVKDVGVHPSLTTNPHSTTAEMVGLGQLENLTYENDYAVGHQGWLAIYSVNAQQQYIGPWVAANSVMEYSQHTYLTTFSQTLLNGIAQANDRIGSAEITLADVSYQMNWANQELASLQASRDTIVSVVAQTQRMNTAQRLVYDNSAFSATLTHLAELEYANYSVGYGASVDGHMQTPSYLPGLRLWLSATNPKNTLFADVLGHVRAVRLADLGPYGCDFANDNPATAPIYGASVDKETGGANTNSEVIRFTNGHHLDQVSGRAVVVMPGMTIIGMFRTGPSGISLRVLTDPLNSEHSGIVINTSDGRSLAITGNGWDAISTPVGSAVADSSAILVGSVSSRHVGECWAASSHALDTTNHPRGVAISPSVWPNTGSLGVGLTQIGNSNFAIDNQGELVDLLLYDRQLSGAEVKVVVNYLRLRTTRNAGLSVDYSGMSFFL